jgi:hypothetical protein
VLWPADLPHAAWTEHSEMRAFVVEFGAEDSAPGLLEGRASEASALGVPVERGVGELTADRSQTRHDPEAGEPA